MHEGEIETDAALVRRYRATNPARAAVAAHLTREVPAEATA